jgi:hypothetical protein
METIIIKELKIMETMFNFLNRYRILRRMTFKDFAAEIGLPETVVRRALIGDTVPHDYNKIMFERYYQNNRAEIIRVLTDNEPINKVETTS